MLYEHVHTNDAVISQSNIIANNKKIMGERLLLWEGERLLF